MCLLGVNRAITCDIARCPLNQVNYETSQVITLQFNTFFFCEKRYYYLAPIGGGRGIVMPMSVCLFVCVCVCVFVCLFVCLSVFSQNFKV